MHKYLLMFGKVVSVVVLGALGAWSYLQVVEYRQTLTAVQTLLQVVQAHEALLRQALTKGVPTVQAVQGAAGTPAAGAQPPAAAPAAAPPPR